MDMKKETRGYRKRKRKKDGDIICYLMSQRQIQRAVRLCVYHNYDTKYNRCFNRKMFFNK